MTANRTQRDGVIVWAPSGSGSGSAATWTWLRTLAAWTATAGCALGCTDGEDSSATSAGAGEDAGAPTEDGAEAGAEGGEATAAAVERGALLPRGEVHRGRIIEIWLDPKGAAAVSLDSVGGVRLWPELPPAQRELAKLEPVRLPYLEPLSMSVAKTADGQFIVAGIDTAQSSRVIAVEPDPDAPGSFRMRERFVLPPDDPMLELHVLDGGERLLALGVDHSLRIYDAHGEELSRFTRYGFAPWQLRFSGPPEDLHIAMVLAGPTRLQRFALKDDSVELIGEPYAVTLDRGPNHNDLALLPTGTHAAVLRRPKARGVEWSLEIHDLESGAIRVMWGEGEIKLRPRMHVVDKDWILLEYGGGNGDWIDINQGAVIEFEPGPEAEPNSPEARFQLPKKLTELPAEARIEGLRVHLPDSEGSVRRRASVTQGLRVVPNGNALVFDPLRAPTKGGEGGAVIEAGVEPDQHYRLTQQSLAPRAVAISNDGELVATVSKDEVIVEDIGGGTHHVITGCAPEGEGKWDAMAFTDDAHLLLVAREEAAICAWREEKIVSQRELPQHYGQTIRVSGPGAGELAVRTEYDYDSVSIELLSFTGNALPEDELAELTRTQRADWPALDSSKKTLGRDALGNRYSLSRAKTRQFNIQGPKVGDDKPPVRKLRVGDDKLEFLEFLPSPNGARVAIKHKRASEYDYYHYEYYYYTPPKTLSVWEIGPNSHELAWEIPADWGLEMAWSADGSRLAMKHQGELLVVEGSGEVVFSRETRGLALEEHPDDPEAAKDEAAKGDAAE